MSGKASIKAYTNYPFTELGDTPRQYAAARKVVIVAWDRNKRVIAIVNHNGKDMRMSVHQGYLFTGPRLKGRVKLEWLGGLPDSRNER